MRLPEPLLNALETVPGFDRDAFVSVHHSGEQLTSIRINPGKFSIDDCQFAIAGAVPWTEYGYYLRSRPSFTFDPLFHAGCYYVQEPSSMFIEYALKQLADLSRPLRILDLCAAPGGKTTHIQSIISADSLLVSNEVIRSRASVLRQNIIKWGAANVVVTTNDPHHFGRLENFFDVLVVDAPCSGSGLFRKDPQAISEWTEDAVQLCSSRQKRILADALPALRENGLLLYATCSYSQEEDEWISDWLCTEKEMHPLALSIKAEWGITESTAPLSGAKGYRFFPHHLQGEGFYIACFTKTTGTSNSKWKTAKLEKPSAREALIVKQWLIEGPVEILQHPWLYGIPQSLLEPYSVIRNFLNVQYAGVAIGTVMKDRLVPEHAFALSNLLHETIGAIDLDYDSAIRYLQKSDLLLPAQAKGFQPVSYRGHNIGWINALQNRVNNYYPKEMRILKQENERRLDK